MGGTYREGGKVQKQAEEVGPHGLDDPQCQQRVQAGARPRQLASLGRHRGSTPGPRCSVDA